jgi:hypothetical protein
MKGWLTGSDILEKLYIGDGLLLDIILDGELKAFYERGDFFKAIDIPQKTVTKKEAEHQKFWDYGFNYFPPIGNKLCCELILDKDADCFLYGPRKAKQLTQLATGSRERYDCFLDISEKCLDEVPYYSCCSRWHQNKDGFLCDPSKIRLPLILTKLISILEDVETNIQIQYYALKALLPVLFFRRADVEAWELYQQGIAPQEIELQRQEPLKQGRKKSEQRKAANFFTRESNDYWHIGFEGKEARIKHLMGLQYIGYLLEKPGTTISCRDLYRAASGPTPANVMSEGTAIGEGLYADHKKQAVSGYEAKQCYWKQWQQLQDYIDNAEESPEGEMVKKESKKKQDEIMPYLKERSFADPDTKKAQSNLKKRLDKAYEAIREEGMENLVKHLKGHIKPDGALGLSYSGTLTWKITR